jgi:F-type H+-transporting ATPase subunit delta
LEKDCLDEVHSDVDTIVGIFKEDESVREFLLNPMIPSDKKKDVIDKLAKDAKLTPYTVNFLGLLIDADRLVSADQIFSTFEERFCEIRETLVATVHCAKDLDDDQRYLVAKKLQEMTGQKNIKIKTSIDESLIAGFVVDYGSAQIDLSIKGQLEEVTQELVAGVSAVA